MAQLDEREKRLAWIYVGVLFGMSLSFRILEVSSSFAQFGILGIAAIAAAHLVTGRNRAYVITGLLIVGLSSFLIKIYAGPERALLAAEVGIFGMLIGSGVLHRISRSRSQRNRDC